MENNYINFSEEDLNKFLEEHKVYLPSITQVSENYYMLDNNPKIIKIDPYSEEDFIKITDFGNIEVFKLSLSEIIEYFEDCLTEEQIKILDNGK